MPAPPSCYTDYKTYDGTDLTDVLIPGGRYMRIVDRFKYLGSWIARNGNDTLDVDSRISSASKAFGALRKCVFRSLSVSRAAKCAVYERLILAILLYGAESWCLMEVLRQRLRVFHAQCLRAMSRVTRADTWRHHISTQALGQEMGINTIDFYITRRQLGWLGHVSRMDYETRLPRKLLSAWIPSKRPTGAPAMTYGRSITKALDNFNFDRDLWPQMAADRSLWRDSLALGRPAIRQSKRLAQKPRAELPAALRPRNRA